MTDNPTACLNTIAMQNLIAITYETVGATGPSHRPMFTIRATLNDHSAEASGTSKKKAKAIACQTILELILDDNKINFDRDKVRTLIDKWNDEKESKMAAEDQAGDDNGKATMLPLLSKAAAISNAVMQLNELCSRKGWSLPIYNVIDYNQKDQLIDFKVECIIEDLNIMEYGHGKNKKQARCEAAEKLLKMLVEYKVDRVDVLFDRKQPFKSDPELAKKLMADVEAWIPETGIQNRNGFSIVLDYLKSNKELLEKLSMIIPDPMDFMENVMQQCQKDTEKVVCSIADCIGCRLVTVLHSKRPQSDQFLFWAEFVKLQPEIPFLSAWGTGENILEARSMALKRLLLFFLFFIEDIEKPDNPITEFKGEEENQQNN